MNIIEMEDMVKGLPDQVLRQYAQFPDPQIPQFLALSEVQRRQDMRQRFQAQQQQAEPSVKDQILQSGIAAAVPPMAPPQGMPQQAPVMMAEGGFVGGAKEFGKVYADTVRAQAATPKGLLSFVPGIGGLIAAADQLRSLKRYFPPPPEATGFGKYFPEADKAGFSLGRVDKVEADPNLVDPESDALDREYQALVNSQQNAMYAPFHSTMTGFDPTAGGTYDPGSQIISSIDAPTIPGGMAAGGVTPGGIVRMQQGGASPLSPEQIRQEYAAAIQSGDMTRANEIAANAAQSGGVNPSDLEAIRNQVTALQEFDVANVAPSVTPEYQQRLSNITAGIPQIMELLQAGAPSSDFSAKDLRAFAPTAFNNAELIQRREDLIKSLEETARTRKQEDIAAAEKYRLAVEAPIKAAQEEARRAAIASTLMRLGSGVAAGDPAKGLASATEAVEGIMTRSQEQAAAERRAAKQEFRQAEREATRDERRTADTVFQLRAQQITDNENQQRQLVRDQKQFAQWAFGMMVDQGKNKAKAYNDSLTLSIGISNAIDQAIRETAKNADINRNQYTSTFGSVFRTVLEAAKQSDFIDPETGESRDLTLPELVEIARDETQKQLQKAGITSPDSSFSLKIGDIRDGYRYKGGEASKETSWEKI